MIDFNIRRKRGKHSDLVKHNGFTLAEVLVTLGIIGVVSAMTVPTLVQNYQRKSYVTQLHKVYNELGQACERYVSDNGYVSLRESRLTNNQAEMARFATTYFKVTKDCGNRYYDSNGNKCYPKTFRSLDGTNESDVSQGQCMKVVTIASGAALCFDSGNIGDASSGEDTNGDGVVDENDKVHSANPFESFDRNAIVMQVETDINGPKGPNITGRDIFSMDVRSDCMVYDADWTKDSTIDTVHAWPTGIGKIIEDGWEMNY